MAVPASINDLSTTAASNSPSGGENPFPDLDNHLRALASFIAVLRDGKLDASVVSAFMLTVLNDADAATARTTLGAVGLTGNETVAGVKTFSSSPIAPTPTTGDNTTKVATTAFVKTTADAAAATAVADRMRVSQIAAKPTTSGTAIPFTGGTDGVPAWAKRVIVLLDLVSTNGSDQVCVSLGTSSGIDKTSYQGSSSFIGAGIASASTIGSGGATIPLTGAGSTRSGRIVFEHVGGNVWTFSGQVGDTSAGNVIHVSGRKSLSDVLTQLSLTTINGTDSFDGGQVSVLYEG